MHNISPFVTQIDGFKITGVSTRTQNATEVNEKTTKLPLLWQQFYTSDLAKNTAVFGIYSDYETDANGFYTVTVGVVADKQQDEFNSVMIHAGQYLVFQGQGSMPAAVIATWQRVWDYFKIDNQYQRCFISDFESYTGLDEVAIYIGIK